MKDHRIFIHCRCGHVGCVTLGYFLHRDEMLRRARCTVCGKRDGWTVIVLPPAGSKGYPG
ncbi:hypothetical protein JCM7686_0812 [Paracoccus aminophilus JCM 7686]|uniref:Uncharacterized protein n=1 Tax=Paracoccus aminophilus JCM 7686 TaxID=1367847 RepID=S5YRN9_PARAH|nr:hypothetical protein JCM7686_0812 [Paracoccus aminophilus JCM 7686]